MKFTKEQRLMIDFLRGKPDLTIRAERWGYSIGRYILNHSTKPYWHHEEPMWVYGSETIKCLIRKGVLITELSSKEFEVQKALGTMDHKIYIY